MVTALQTESLGRSVMGVAGLSVQTDSCLRGANLSVASCQAGLSVHFC